MSYQPEITCPRCSEKFQMAFETAVPKGKLTCPHCRETFNCDACNYSWAKWARNREDCGAPCREKK